jgi:hypothetical protein
MPEIDGALHNLGITGCKLVGRCYKKHGRKCELVRERETAKIDKQALTLKTAS